MDENISYVYGHFDNKNRCRYIGQGRRQRAWNRIKRSKLWKEIFKLHNPKVVIFKNAISEKEALSLEVELIKDFKSKGQCDLNKTKGGEKGYVSHRKLTKEHKQAISKAKEGKSNGLEGRVMPLEHKLKISEAHKGKKMPREGVEKQRKAIMGRPSPKRKPVKCIENGRIYSHAKEAAEALDCNEKHIQAVCAGRRKRTGGYHFEYDVI